MIIKNVMMNYLRNIDESNIFEGILYEIITEVCIHLKRTAAIAFYITEMHSQCTLSFDFQSILRVVCSGLVSRLTLKHAFVISQHCEVHSISGRDLIRVI